MIQSIVGGVAKLTVLSAILIGTNVWAGGFEKNITWSGKCSGIAGACASSVSGSESIYFNPAGLLRTETMRDLSFNLSPTSAQYSGMVLETDTEQTDAEKTMSPIMALNFAHRVRDKMAFGVGYYVAGGTSVLYEDVKLGAATADFQSKMTIPVFALAGAYRVGDAWNVGLSWRIAMPSAEFATASTTASGVPAGYAAIIEYSDLKGVSYDGFRLGATYAPSDDWGLGFVYRSKISMKLEGSATQVVRSLTNNSLLQAKEGDVEVESELPQGVMIGAHYAFTEMWTGYSELWWINYSAIDKLAFESKNVGDNEIATEWQDQWNIRLAAQHGKDDAWPIRFGYTLTTAVVSDDRARATFSSPGLAHTVTVGTAYQLSNSMKFDGAFEYSKAGKEVDGNDANDVGAGTYESTAMALHLGVSWGF